MAENEIDRETTYELHFDDFCIGTFENEDSTRPPSMGDIIFDAITSVFIFSLAKFLLCDTDFLNISFQRFGQPNNFLAIYLYQVVRLFIYSFRHLGPFGSMLLIGLVSSTPILLIHLLDYIDMKNNFPPIPYTMKDSLLLGFCTSLFIIMAQFSHVIVGNNKFYVHIIFMSMAIHMTLYISFSVDGKFGYSFILFYITDLILYFLGLYG